MRLTSARGLIVACLVMFFGTARAASITHGPIVGAVTDQSARVLVRLDAVGDGQLQFTEIAGNYASPIVSSLGTTEATRDFFVIVDVAGLNADTEYFYRTLVDGAPAGEEQRFRTFPADGDVLPEWTFAFGGCQNAGGDPVAFDGNIWARVIESDPRFFLHLGDYGYPDTTDTALDPLNTFNTDFSRIQESYRYKYREDYPMEGLFEITSMDYVYDDHDYSNNNSDTTAPGRENSIRGYQEMFPGYELATDPAPEALYHSFTFGNAEFFVLDTRSLRRPNIEAFPNILDWLNDPQTFLQYAPQAGHRILGTDQMNWLIDGVSNSTATWKFICSSVPLNPGARAGLELGLLLQNIPEFDPIATPSGILRPAEIAIEFSDAWGGFPTSVADLVSGLAANDVENVIWLAADSHTAAIDDGTNSLIPEFMAGGLDRTNSQIVALQEQFGIFAWTPGGQGASQTNFDEHFGKMTVFGDEFVVGEIIDTQGNVITTHTVQAGRQVPTVGLNVAPQGQEFEVSLGETALNPFVLVNFGADPLVVQDFAGLQAPFQIVALDVTPTGLVPNPTDLPPYTINGGEDKLFGVIFAPTDEGSFLNEVAILSNDPDGITGLRFFGTATTDPVSALAGGLRAEQGAAGIEVSFEAFTNADVAAWRVLRAVDGRARERVSDLAPETGLLTVVDRADGVSAGSELSYTVQAIFADGTQVEIGGDVRLTLQSTPNARGIELGAATPNPFNPSTTISYRVDRPQNVVLRVVNVAGEEVTRLVDGRVDAGEHLIEWNGTDSRGRIVASGVYFYALGAEGFAQTRKMTLVK